MTGFKFAFDKEELLKAIDKRMDEVTDFIFTNSQQNIINKGIVDEGSLLKSGNINREFLSKEIVYSAPHADIPEYGRQPGQFVPLSPLQGWVKRKLGVKDDKKAKQIAWAISQDIKKNGLQPRPYLQPAIDLAINKYK